MCAAAVEVTQPKYVESETDGEGYGDELVTGWLGLEGVDVRVCGSVGEWCWAEG